MKLAIPERFAYGVSSHTLRLTIRMDSQFNERPTDDNADTAYVAMLVPGRRKQVLSRHTCRGETSGIITKGTGPIPIAKDLEGAVSVQQWQDHPK